MSDLSSKIDSINSTSLSSLSETYNSLSTKNSQQFSTNDDEKLKVIEKEVKKSLNIQFENCDEEIRVQKKLKEAVGRFRNKIDPIWLEDTKMTESKLNE